MEQTMNIPSILPYNSHKLFHLF